MNEENKKGGFLRMLLGTLSASLYVNANNIVYFDNFGAEHIPRKI